MWYKRPNFADLSEHFAENSPVVDFYGIEEKLKKTSWGKEIQIVKSELEATHKRKCTILRDKNNLCTIYQYTNNSFTLEQRVEMDGDSHTAFLNAFEKSIEALFLALESKNLNEKPLVIWSIAPERFANAVVKKLLSKNRFKEVHYDGKRYTIDNQGRIKNEDLGFKEQPMQSPQEVVGPASAKLI